MKTRNAFCSFCRKSYTDVGPLVEGPGEVYVCGACAELCQAIIYQERRRRKHSQEELDLAPLRQALDSLVRGQVEAKQALLRAASLQDEGKGFVLLVGPSDAARFLFARALAHVLSAPFAAGNSNCLISAKNGGEKTSPLLLSLLEASEFDAQAAQRGVVYVEGADEAGTQDLLLRLWQDPVPLTDQQAFDGRRVLVVCGAAFAGLERNMGRSGHHLEQPITADDLEAAGARPQWTRRLSAIARAPAIDDETLTLLLGSIDFSRINGHKHAADVFTNPHPSIE